MKNVIVFGAGEIAKVAHYYLTNDSSYEVCAFTVDADYRIDKQFCGLPVVDFETIEKDYPPERYAMLIAIGYHNVNKLRATKYYDAKKKGYQLISYVNSKSTIAKGVEIGDNCFILEHQVIQPRVKIGDNVMIWSGNHIGHGSTIEDHCYIASHVVISGQVKIEPYCFLGVNCTIRDGITIAKQCVIGAGAVILKSTVEKGVYAVKSTELHVLNSSELKRI